MLSSNGPCVQVLARASNGRPWPLRHPQLQSRLVRGSARFLGWEGFSEHSPRALGWGQTGAPSSTLRCLFWREIHGFICWGQGLGRGSRVASGVSFPRSGNSARERLKKPRPVRGVGAQVVVSVMEMLRPVCGTQTQGSVSQGLWGNQKGLEGW